MGLVDAATPALARLSRFVRKRIGVHDGMEIIYRELLLRELAKLGIPDRFFPVGSAANHSLLYLVLRCYVELPVSRILDVGAGQTSLLLDELNRKLGKAQITTLEHDPHWARWIGGQVAHPVLRRELVSMRLAGIQTLMHDTAGLPGPFDLIVMDGPPGRKRYSRLGLLHLMQQFMDRQNFIVIMDDAERGGEMQTLQLCRRWLRESAMDHSTSVIRAAKRQEIFAAGELLGATYF
jgi:predicted O-methyltransferase YrrM